MLLVLHEKYLFSLSQFNQKMQYVDARENPFNGSRFRLCEGMWQSKKYVLAVPQIKSPNLMLFTMVTGVTLFNFARDVHKKEALSSSPFVRRVGRIFVQDFLPNIWILFTIFLKRDGLKSSACYCKNRD